MRLIKPAVERETAKLYYGLRALVAVALLFFLAQGEWFSALSTLAILFLMLIPAFLRGAYRVHLPFELEFGIVAFIFLSLFLGSLENVYEDFPLWDGILHFQSGLLSPLVGFVLVYQLNERKSKRIALSPGFVSFFAGCFSMTLGVVWEIYEYAVDHVLGFHMQRSGLEDTMGDLIVNAVGTTIIGLISYFWMHRQGRIPFTPQRLEESPEKTASEK